MTPLALFQELHALGVRLTPYPDGTVRWCGGTGLLAPDLLAALHAQQAALHDLVEAFDERAALLEFDGGLSRDQAETLAWEAFVLEEQARETRACSRTMTGTVDATAAPI